MIEDTPRTMTPWEVRAWRASHGMAQNDLAGLLGVTRLTVARWELGTRTPPPFLPFALAHLETFAFRFEDLPV